MVAILVVVGVVVLLALGFYWTRGAAGPAPFDAEGRVVDVESRASPLGDPISAADEDATGGPQHEPAPQYIAEVATPSEEVWAREEARYRAKNEGQQ